MNVLGEEILRMTAALESIAAELERLRMLKEYELGVRIEYEDGDPYIAAKLEEE